MSLIDTIKSLCCNFCKKSESAPKDKEKAKPKTEAEKETSVKKDIKSEAAEIKATKLQVPEDSALKRHFMSALKAQIESDMQPCPTESTLKRHYDSTVQAKLENLLG